MKILFVYDKMPGIYQNYLNVFLNYLKTKLSITILTYGEKSGGDIEIESYRLKDKFQRLLYKFKLSEFTSLDIKNMNKFDIIHIQHSYLKDKILPLLDQESKPKIVITLRGSDTYMKPWIIESWRTFYKTYGNKIDAFITMSHHQKNYLLRWGVDEERIHVIPISFGMAIDSKPKYPNGKMLKLVSAFRMTWEKNIEGCLLFAKTLKEKKVAFVYDIYGDGNDLDQLYYLVDKFELNDFVKIKGKVENNKLKANLSGYDFFLQLSLSEALPTTVLEAQSQGLPCIVSNSDGLPESVINNVTAIVGDYNLVDMLAEECLKVWKDKELYFSFSKNAILHANKSFSVEVESDRLMTLYNNLINPS